MERFYMTSNGLEYVSKTATGSILKFTQGKFGDGTLSGSVTDLTELVNPLGTMPISKSTTNGNAITIQTQFSNKVNGTILSPFYLKEIGLFAKLLNSDGTDNTAYPETLVAYAYASGTDQGDRIPGVLTEFIINWPCTVGNAQNVQVNTSSIAYALQVDLEKKADKQNANGGFNGGSNTITYAGCAIGHGATSNAGAAVGMGAQGTNGLSAGYNAKCIDANGNPIDAIQLGTGTNKMAKTLQVYNYQLMDATGNIPKERIKSVLDNNCMKYQKISSLTDFDTLTDVCFYNYAYSIQASEKETVHSPTSGSGTLITLNYNGVFGTQLWNHDSEKTLYVRNKHNNVWGSWLKIADEDTLNAALSSKADKSELHSHSNKTVLDGITADKITSWDAKADVRILQNENVSFISETGIYNVEPSCTGLPNGLDYNDADYGMTLIVSKRNNGMWEQYLLVNTQTASGGLVDGGKTDIYACERMPIISNGKEGVTTSMPWTKIISTANIKQNPNAKDGDIIDTHLTVGVRTGEVGTHSFVSGGSADYPNEASGDYSVVIGGESNTANYYAAVLGGDANTASDTGTAVIGGHNNTASGYLSAVLGGTDNTASGSYSAAIGGNGNTSSQYHSAVIGGENNSASANYSAVIGGSDNVASGAKSAVIGGEGLKTQNESEVAIGKYNSTSDTMLFTIGNGTSDTDRVNVFSVDNSGNGVFSGTLTVGFRTGNIGEHSFVSGGSYDGISDPMFNEASGNYSAAVGGCSNAASGHYSAVIGGVDNVASGYEGVVIGGESNTVDGQGGVVLGGFLNTAKTCQVKMGHHSKGGIEGTNLGTTGDGLIIGNGTFTAKSNCFRVGYDGYVYGGKTFGANAADVAELYEWQDGNPNNEDRRGLFVTLDGEKIKLASPTDDVIGVISALPCLVGNSYSDNWQGMYLKDVFGVPLKQTVHHEAEYKDGKLIREAYDAEEYIINPDYDPEQEYIPREQRPEFDYVTDWGIVVLVDDGTCEVNGYATVGESGKATKADNRTLIRVMKRIDDTHIYVSIKNRLI